LAPLRRSRPQLTGAVVALVALAALGFVPLFAGPGYESALGAGLLLPVLAGCVTALEVARVRPEPFHALARGVASGGLLAGIGLVVTLVHGLRAGFCDASEGIQMWLLGPIPGAVLGGAWGGVAALAAPRRPRIRVVVALGLAVLGPLGGILVSLWRFYSSPMVFAFDPFFGFFSGPLYDTVIDASWSLASYRVGSACTLAAAAVLCRHLRRREDGGIRLGWLGQPGWVIWGAIALVTSFAITVNGPSLGHYSTVASIRAELARSVATARCDVVHSPGVLARDALALSRDCDAHVRVIERYFGVAGPERITVYLFASAEEKGRLMGAAQTYIAKPWRSEVYLQIAPYPHPVLGHELAHVVSGAFGAGPFRVAGPLAGLIPDPGRIEGVAVAAAPDEDDDLTTQEWARAMLDLGLLPPLTSVFRLSFFGENASKAYTVAGAFVEWLHRTHGAEVVRRWYGGGALRELTGKDLGELDQAFRASLASVAVSPRAMHTAKARFDRPAIFGRSCPHVVDRLEQEAGAHLNMNDAVGCRERYQAALELDPGHVRSRIGLGTCELRAGDVGRAVERFREVSADPAVPRLFQVSALEAIADQDLAAGRVDAAVKRYAEIEAVLVDEDRLRTLEVKRGLRGDLGRRAVVSLLIGENALGPSWDVAAARLGEWSAADPSQGLADYLLGRNLHLRGRWNEAAESLERGIQRGISTPLVRRESLKMRMVVACALEDRGAARTAYQRYLAEPELSAARRLGIERFAERCQVQQ
jgi:tetratricopeptide (TPR) repeat protein